MLLGQAILALNLVQVSDVELDCNKRRGRRFLDEFIGKALPRLVIARKSNYADIYSVKDELISWTRERAARIIDQG